MTTPASGFLAGPSSAESPSGGGGGAAAGRTPTPPAVGRSSASFPTPSERSPGLMQITESPNVSPTARRPRAATVSSSADAAQWLERRGRRRGSGGGSDGGNEAEAEPDVDSPVVQRRRTPQSEPSRASSRRSSGDGSRGRGLDLEFEANAPEALAPDAGRGEQRPTFEDARRAALEAALR